MAWTVIKRLLARRFHAALPFIQRQPHAARRPARPWPGRRPSAPDAPAAGSCSCSIKRISVMAASPTLPFEMPDHPVRAFGRAGSWVTITMVLPIHGSTGPTTSECRRRIRGQGFRSARPRGSWSVADDGAPRHPLFLSTGQLPDSDSMRPNPTSRSASSHGPHAPVVRCVSASGSSTFSAAVQHRDEVVGLKDIQPMARAPAAPSRLPTSVSLVPATTTDPPVGPIDPAITFSNVLLPDPDGPMIARKVPGRNVEGQIPQDRHLDAGNGCSSL